MSADQQQGGVSVAEVEECIKGGLETSKLIVLDVSSGCGAKFELYICSEKFKDMKLLERHRFVNGLLTEKGLMKRIHAVTIKAWTEADWTKNAAQIPQQASA